MKKKGNGEGHIRKRPDGRWEARLTFTAYNGKPKRKSFYGETKKEVLDRMTDYRYTLIRKQNVNDHKMLLITWLQIWLNSRRNELRDTTLANYSILIHKHLRELGTIPLQEVQTFQIQELFMRLKTSGLSDRTVKLLHQILSMAYKKVRIEKLIDYYPTEAVLLPRLDNPKEKQVLEPNEVQQLLDSIVGHKFEAAVVLALMTGMRIGEILALSWSDYDSESATIKVHKTLQNIYFKDINDPDKTESYMKIQDQTKTRVGNRIIVIPPYAVEALERRLQIQQTEIDNAGKLYQHHDLIFSSEIGTPIDTSNFRRTFKKMLKTASIKSIRVHDMRHTFTSVLADTGVNMKTLQDTLGHS